MYNTFPTRTFKFIWIFIMLAGTSVWLYFTVDYLLDIKYAHDSKNWPTTSGQVLSHDTELRTQANSSSRLYIPLVEYQYVVDGKTYTRNEISFFPPEFGSKGQARDFLGQSDYAIGSDLQLFYKPGSPEISVLEPGGAPYKTGSVILVSAIIWAIVAFIAYSIYKSSSKASW